MGEYNNEVFRYKLARALHNLIRYNKQTIFRNK